MSAVSNKQSAPSTGEWGASPLKASAKRFARSLAGQGAYDFASLVKRNHKRWLAWPFVHLRIACKWFRDKKHLPLSREHWQLYAIVHHHCWNELQDFPELINPRDFNDRIQWLKLFDQTEEHVLCSDKIRVRDYVRERVGDNYLVQIYQVCETFDQVDFDRLPRAFVLKTNHDSGTVFLVRNKETFDRNAVKSHIENSLRGVFGWENGEWAYAFAEPKILIEEFIRPDATTPPPDYKFQCVEGVVKFCRYTFDRGVDTKEIVVDRSGHVLDLIIDENFKRGSEFRQPEAWPQMVRLAETLSAGFKCVRVDLFEDDNHLYAGEMTFFPSAGTYSGEGQKIVGPLLDFDRTSFKPPIYRQLARTARR